MRDDLELARADRSTTIRKRIAGILDELAALPRHEIAARAALDGERQTLSAELRDLHADDSVTAGWAARARHRPADVGRPFIASPSDGGGSPG